MFRPFIVWILLALLAISNGMVREAVFSPAWGPAAGHAISSALLVVLIVIVSAASLNFLQIDAPARAWTVGAYWLALTLAFEFLAGHFLFGNEWETILHDYNVLAGRVWVAVPLATLSGPRLALMARTRFN